MKPPPRQLGGANPMACSRPSRRPQRCCRSAAAAESTWGRGPCKGVAVHIGVLGGTGPEGKAMAVRLASVGIDVTVGSRSHDRAVATCQELQDKWTGRALPLRAGDNQHAAEAP